MQTRPTQLRPHATIGAGRADAPTVRRYDTYCLRLNAALGNLLKPRGVCLSMKEIDMDIVGKALNINVTVAPDGVFGAGGSAKALDTFCTSKKRWVVAKIGVPGPHVTIALIDRSRKIIEWFDSGGTYEPIPDTTTISPDYSILVQGVFKQILPSYRFITVNKAQTFQEDEIDDYCQTWIFWYLFQRIVVGESRRSIMAALMGDTPKQRVERIRAFSRYALTL